MITLDIVRAALTLRDFDHIQAQSRMAPIARPMAPPRKGKTPRQAGVLILIFPDQHTLRLVLTRRNDNLRGHSGQISFPGGQRDPQDISFEQTALRETCEELGVCDELITILGSLSSIYIPPSNFQVFPTVGYVTYPPQFAPNPGEVAEVFTLPLDDLLDDRIKAQEDWDFQGYKVPIPFYRVNGHKVWGATAIMLSEFENRLRAVS